MPTQDVGEALVRAARKLNRGVSKINFSTVAAFVYNPLDYAWKPHAEYIKRFASPNCRVLLLGMNPGPWGMAQTGVPFGEINAVTDWMKIEAPVGKPAVEHPKRPIEGFACSRSEVSGRRLWGLFAEKFPKPEAFFDQHFVCNYCPLVFMETSARNVTPDKLPVDQRRELETVCDEHLASVIRTLEPEFLIGVGAWAEGCLKRVCDEHTFADKHIGRILHPSPASPAANRDWAGTALKQLREQGVWTQ